MAHTWQTIEEAAVNLKVSTRTLHRRISAGDLQTRLENGRREVLVCLPDNVAKVELTQEPLTDTHQTRTHDTHQHTSAVLSDAANSMADTPNPHVNEYALALSEERTRRAELALTAYQHSIAIAEGSAKRARVAGYFAWSTTGALVAVIIFATAWATHHVTRSQADVENLSRQVQTLTDTADKRGKEAEKYRSDAEEARIAAAKAQAELQTRKAIVTVPANATTQPTSLIRKVADMLAGQWKHDDTKKTIE